ncbi:uncharacterized protein LOC132563886 [Ylistrum balloti]|uniref:uncharacterized protein LOC132563886 n=1 Tax=Ylistrum balloti TaxID=509963 RepID=UPI002905A86E|nr:uncharacterized protein LOC132563886 [Ylistrum balloti]
MSFLNFSPGLSSACGSCYKKPTFTSGKTVLEAQISPSEAVFEHELNVIPVKVDVQVTPKSDPQSIFPGVGSAQRDDDEDGPYGGVVYKYNDGSVIVYAPNRWDGFSTGSVIYTGGSTWTGPTQMKENRANVRVRVWSPMDFPCPDYVKTTAVQAGPGRGTFKELAHGLGTVPEYVTVQVIHGSSKWVSDGIGYVMTSSMTSINTSWGGVLYAYNESHIRIWTPSTDSGSLYSSADGWGRKHDETVNSGSLVVKMWKFFNGVDVFSKSQLIGNKATIVEKEMSFTPSTFDTDHGLLTAMVKSTDGPNANFLFPATGAVQNAETIGSYGGLVYSYSTFGIKLWQPPSRNGYLIYISDNWGGGVYKQSSNSAQLEVRAWNVYDICPTTVATSSTLVPASTPTRAPVNNIRATSVGQRSSSFVGKYTKTNTNSPVVIFSNASTNPQLAGDTSTLTVVNMNGGNTRRNATAKAQNRFKGLTVDLPWWAVGVISGAILLLLIGSISGVVLGILRAKDKGKVRSKEKEKVSRFPPKDHVNGKKQAWDI